MIIDLPQTTSSRINKAMVDLREQGGTNALGRVLTLVIVTTEANAEDPIAAANAASFEHPCRVIVVAQGQRRASARMDAQIRVGGDAGASEVIVLRLYGALADHGASVVVPLLLADAPVVAWWPGESPEIPAEDPIGALAQRRITDVAAAKRPVAELGKRVDSYRPGDTDLAWTRITTWRGLLAAALDQPPQDKVHAVTVTAAGDSAAGQLLAAWLALELRCPVTMAKPPARGSKGLSGVVLHRKVGDVKLIRPEGITANFTVANQPERQVALPRRSLRDCLAEELRRLDADEVYAEVLSRGLAALAKQTSAPPASAASGGRPRAGANGGTSTSGGRTAERTGKPPAKTTRAIVAAADVIDPKGRTPVTVADAEAADAGSTAKASPAKASPAKASPAKASPAKKIAEGTGTPRAAADASRRSGG